MIDPHAGTGQFADRPRKFILPDVEFQYRDAIGDQQRGSRSRKAHLPDFHGGSRVGHIDWRPRLTRDEIDERDARTDRDRSAMILRVDIKRSDPLIEREFRADLLGARIDDDRILAHCHNNEAALR